MRRLEQRKSKKFWEIEVEGPELTIRRGKIGKRAKVERTVHASSAAAEADAMNKYRARLAKGWVEAGLEAWTLVDTFARGPRERELEQAIHENPSDPQAWAVYADWLQDRDDPWGERIALSLTQAAQPKPTRTPGILPPLAEAEERDELDTRIAELDEDLRERLYGPNLARLMARRDFGDLARLGFRHGFITSATLDHGGQSSRHWGSPTMGQVLAALLLSPAARFLESLMLTINLDNSEHISKALDLMKASHEDFDSLRSLVVWPDREFETLIDGEFDPRPSLGSIDWLVNRTPRLRRLKLNGDSVFFSSLIHPNIQTLVLETRGLDFGCSLEQFGQARLPACERLGVSLGSLERDAAKLEPLFEGEGLPSLRRLELQLDSGGDALMAMLAPSPLLRRLERFALIGDELGDAGVDAILAHADAFAGLDELALDSRLPHALVRRLSALETRLRVSRLRYWSYL